MHILFGRTTHLAICILCFFIYIFTMSCSSNGPLTNGIPIKSQRRPLKIWSLICLLRLILPSALDCNLAVKDLVFKGLTPVSRNVPISMQGLGLYIIRLLIAGDCGLTSLADKIFINLIWWKTDSFLKAQFYYFYALNSRLGRHQTLDLSNSRQRPEEAIPLGRLGKTFYLIFISND